MIQLLGNLFCVLTSQMSPHEQLLGRGYWGKWISAFPKGRLGRYPSSTSVFSCAFYTILLFDVFTSCHANGIRQFPSRFPTHVILTPGPITWEWWYKIHMAQVGIEPWDLLHERRESYLWATHWCIIPKPKITHKFGQGHDITSLFNHCHVLWSEILFVQLNDKAKEPLMNQNDNTKYSKF